MRGMTIHGRVDAVVRRGQYENYLPEREITFGADCIVSGLGFPNAQRKLLLPALPHT